jgi:hypothetical protein
VDFLGCSRRIISPLSPEAGARGQGQKQFRFAWCVIYFLISGIASAEDAAMPEQDVREQSKRILDDPEYRYFDHLDGSPERPQSRFWKPRAPFGSKGSGGEGESGGSSRGTAGSSHSRESRNDADSSASGDDFGSSSSLGSGLSAIGNVFGVIFHFLAYLVLIAVCGLIVYLVAQAILNRDRTPESIATPMLNLDVPQEEDHSPGELPADAYLAKARELAEQRKYREAIAHLLLGVMSAIERTELIRHRRGLTLRDYLRVLRGKSPQYDGFKSLIGLYEPIGFGRRVASFQTFQDALSGYEQAVAALAA